MVSMISSYEVWGSSFFDRFSAQRHSRLGLRMGGVRGQSWPTGSKALVTFYIFLHEGALYVSEGQRPKACSTKRSTPHQPGQEVFKTILSEDVDWKPFPAFPPSVRLAVVVGQPSEPGPYTIRVKAPHGAKLMPHKHQEDRVYTVISGVFYIGLGETNSTRTSWKPIRRAAWSFSPATRPISTGQNPASTSPKSPRWGRWTGISQSQRRSAKQQS